MKFPDGFSKTLPGKAQRGIWKFRSEISRDVSRENSQDISHPKFVSENSPWENRKFAQWSVTHLQELAYKDECCDAHVSQSMTGQEQDAFVNARCPGEI